MSDCQHREISRYTGEHLQLPTGTFLYGCKKCKETFFAALEGTIQAAELLHKSRSLEPSIEAPIQEPDHSAALSAAVKQFATAGLDFETWAKMLREGSVSEAIFTRQAVSLGLQLGDVEQLIAAVYSSPESLPAE